MSSLTLHAGPRAREKLLAEGLRAEDFRVIVGASGGPKWFVLYGLDRFLFGDFFAGRKRELLSLGSSAGAWRLACLSMTNPVAAIDRLAREYSHQRYSSNSPNVKEVTERACELLDSVLGEDGARQIANNRIIRSHILSVRCKGLMSAPNKYLQSGCLGLAAGANVLSRRLLSGFFQRTIFTNMGQQSPWAAAKDIDTTVVELVPDNVRDALIASGSIPFVLEGVRDIEGAPKGLYWDGGIVDYHFDLPFLEDEGLVLYPHFRSTVIPGWFDKHLSWRKAAARHFDNVVILAPSQEFVADLPGGKLPDRTDFDRYDYDERIKVFGETLDRSVELAEELETIVEQGLRPEQILPIERLRG